MRSDTLEATQEGHLDITAWLIWFLGCLDRAFKGAEVTLSGILHKTRCWEAIKAERTKSSPDTALRGFGLGHLGGEFPCE